jgi:copper chaperone CopZ
MKRNEVKGINVNLEDQKVVIYLEKETDIEDTVISTIFEDAGYTVETINRSS